MLFKTMSEIQHTMRFDSCRKCGKELEVEKKCHMCNEPTIFHCAKCIYSTVEQICFKCKSTMIEVSIKR